MHAQACLQTQPGYVKMCSGCMRGLMASGAYLQMLLWTCAEVFLVQLANGSYAAPPLGEVCCQRPAYADTLERVAELGSAAVYNQDTAEVLSAEIQYARAVLPSASYMSCLVQLNCKCAVISNADLMGQRNMSAAKLEGYCRACSTKTGGQHDSCMCSAGQQEAS